MNVQNIVNNQMQKDLTALSWGTRINKAGDDAAGMAIVQKILAEENGLRQGNDNTANMNNLTRTAEGGLSNISDSLQRVRELSLQAANGTMSDSDKQLIQNEINQTLQGIDQMSGSTEFNGMKLLDGTFTNKNTASNPDGTGASISINSMSLQALGLDNYSVMGEIDLSKLDSAIEAVSSARSELGATSNRYQYTMDANSIAELNMASAKSRIYDADMAKSISDYNKNEVLSQYQISMQQNNMKNQRGMLAIFN